jgi:hypothetical protein
MPTGPVDSGIGDRSDAEDKLVLGRERIDPLRIFFHEEIDTESFST